MSRVSACAACAPPGGRGVVEQREERVEQALEHGGVELALAREVVVDRLRPDPDPVGHVAERCGVEAALREHRLGGVEDPLGRVLGHRREDTGAASGLLVDNHS